jgi:hypothetical protein
MAPRQCSKPPKSVRSEKCIKSDATASRAAAVRGIRSAISLAHSATMARTTRVLHVCTAAAERPNTSATLSADLLAARRYRVMQICSAKGTASGEEENSGRPRRRLTSSLQHSRERRKTRWKRSSVICGTTSDHHWRDLGSASARSQRATFLAGTPSSTAISCMAAACLAAGPRSACCPCSTTDQ